MIYIRVEMWPKGDRKRARTLAEATVENLGGTKSRANYLARISKRSGFRVPKGHAYSDPELARVCRPAPSSIWKETVVEAFPRSVRGAWDLLYRALCGCVGDRN